MASIYEAGVVIDNRMVDCQHALMVMNGCAYCKGAFHWCPECFDQLACDVDGACCKASCPAWEHGSQFGNIPCCSDFYKKCRRDDFKIEGI